MSIHFYCDNQRHLVCLPYSEPNLHAMAEALGIKSCWFHRHPWPHYDIPKRRVVDVMRNCHFMPPRHLVRLVRQNKANGQCMVCGCPLEMRNDFGKATGQGLCNKVACREAMVEAGIV